MAKRPENRRVDISPSDQMSLIMGVAKAIENRRGRKKDKEYQEFSNEYEICAKQLFKLNKSILDKEMEKEAEPVKA